MNRDNYPVKVSNLMETTEKSVLSNAEEFEKASQELERYAADMRDDYLKGFCLFYRGYASYAAAELEVSMGYLSEALNILIGGEDWHLVSKTYNAMGNIADFQGDSSLAIECYIKGLVMSREHEIQQMEYDIQSNIANVYIALGDPASAVEMLLSCERLREEGVTVHPESATIVCANLCQCYIQLGELEKASEQMERLKMLCETTRTAVTDISINILETELYHGLGNFEARDAAIERLSNQKFGSMTIFDALTEFCRHCMLLLEIGKMDEFLRMLEQIEFLVNGPAVEKQVVELRMRYYEKIGDRPSYLELAGRYYEVARQREKERDKIMCHNITTRIRLDEEENRRKEVELSNLMLKQKSEQDPLTKLNNRYKLNELSELAFHKAYLNGTPLTIEILDIDCFKEFNDNYGHQAGDDCLIRIADAIRSMEEYSGVHTARYGGDEFVIIYEEYTKKDVEKMAQQLQDKISRLNIEHKYSKVTNRVTISQGLFHKIPSGGNKPWDFLYGADMTLYGVKSRGKNHFYVGTDFEEVRQRYNEARANAGKKTN